MYVRDAVDEDAPAMADLADLPRAAADRLLRERRVRVAAEDADDEIVGFAAYDTYNGAIHVTRLAGDEASFDDLLDEPRGLARSEDLPVEVVVPESDEETRRAVETLGFEARENGPRFEGEETRKYRWDPA
ncbi:hypothetical protein [Halospeciosus flavus]|uniref:N-acetyltransferase domain-containing protein n=1 Tax=Halospeciosus flavus TaxID=3032283 RepID=A0ABD5Z7L7_9EURY|nr:hypothetical protein [Halospeciosus flavus]